MRSWDLASAALLLATAQGCVKQFETCYRNGIVEAVDGSIVASGTSSVWAGLQSPDCFALAAVGHRLVCLLIDEAAPGGARLFVRDEAWTESRIPAAADERVAYVHAGDGQFALLLANGSGRRVLTLTHSGGWQVTRVPQWSRLAVSDETTVLAAGVTRLWLENGVAVRLDGEPVLALGDSAWAVTSRGSVYRWRPGGHEIPRLVAKEPKIRRAERRCGGIQRCVVITPSDEGLVGAVVRGRYGKSRLGYFWTNGEHSRWSSGPPGTTLGTVLAESDAVWVSTNAGVYRGRPIKQPHWTQMVEPEQCNRARDVFSFSATDGESGLL